MAAGAAHALDLDLEPQADGVGLADPLVRRALGLGAEAREGLEAHGPAVVQRDDGLEDGGDGVGVVEDLDDGRAPLRERGGVAGGVVHAVQPAAVEGDHPPPPGLGRGEPLVHGRHRVDGGGGVVGEDHEGGARAQLAHVVGRDAADDLRQMAGGGRVVADPDPGEPVGAETAPDAPGEGRRLEARGHAREEGVAGAVAVLGVPAAEAVEVHGHDDGRVGRGWPPGRHRRRGGRTPASRGTRRSRRCRTRRGPGGGPRGARRGRRRWSTRAGRRTSGRQRAGRTGQRQARSRRASSWRCRARCASRSRAAAGGRRRARAPSRRCSRHRGQRAARTGAPRVTRKVTSRVRERQRGEGVDEPDEGGAVGHVRAPDRVVEGGQQEQVEGDRARAGRRSRPPRGSSTRGSRTRRSRACAKVESSMASASRARPRRDSSSAGWRSIHSAAVPEGVGEEEPDLRPGGRALHVAAGGEEGEVRHAAERPAQQPVGHQPPEAAPRRPWSGGRPGACAEAEAGDDAGAAPPRCPPPTLQAR